MRPMSVLTTKMPAIVTLRDTSRNDQPASDPMVPGSRVRSRLAHIASRKLSSPSVAATCRSASAIAASSTTRKVTIANQRMSGPVPDENVVSMR